METKGGLQERLEIVRKSTGLSQAAFGEQLNLSDRAYKNYELGIRELPLRVAIDIAEKFKVNVNWLITGEGARSTPTIGQALEDAVVAVREHFETTGKKPPIDKEAAIIRFVFEEILREGGLNPERANSYLRTI